MQRIQVVLVVEGREDEQLLRAFLSGRRVRSVRTLMPSPGSQSGEQYVREQYPLEARSYRRNRNRVTEALIVMTDADRLSVAQRRRTLDDALRASGQAPRADDERIVLLLPRRNVETWVAQLNGASVDEETDYKPQPMEAFAGASQALREHCSDGRSGCCPPSLVDGCAELRRLD